MTPCMNEAVQHHHVHSSNEAAATLMVHLSEKNTSLTAASVFTASTYKPGLAWQTLQPPRARAEYLLLVQLPRYVASVIRGCNKA